MSKNKKQCPVMKYLKDTKVSVLTGTLALFTQSIIILNLIPSMDVQGQSVLQANIEALLHMI